jgi:hypothetical protein
MGTEVSRLGTDRSSMEALLLTCLQAQLLFKRINVTDLTPKQKNDLVWEVKQLSPQKCNIDAKAD